MVRLPVSTPQGRNRKKGTRFLMFTAISKCAQSVSCAHDCETGTDVSAQILTREKTENVPSPCLDRETRQLCIVCKRSIERICIKLSYLSELPYSSQTSLVFSKNTKLIKAQMLFFCALSDFRVIGLHKNLEIPNFSKAASFIIIVLFIRLEC